MPHTEPKFKMLASGYFNFKFPLSLLEEVDLTTFCKPENERLPLFIGTQFGLSPKFNFSLLEGQLIAILHRSQLSGYQRGISIYRIINGERKEIDEIALEPPFWNEKDLVEFSNEVEVRVIHPGNRIPEGYRFILDIYLDSLVLKETIRSLSDVYHLVIRNSYPSFLEYAYENREASWNDYFNCSGFYTEFFVFLDKCRYVVCPDDNNLPINLEDALKLFRNIKNPYQVRSRKYFELPESPDILVLSDLALNIYYNNYINVNALEAQKIQDDIIEEFREREYYVVNPYQLEGHANPVAIWNICGGGKKLAVNKYLPYRKAKDVVNIENRSNGLLKYEAAYGSYNKYTDMELVQAVNDEIEPTIWNRAISLRFKALLSQFERRNIDFSALKNKDGYILDNCVIIDDKKLIKLGNLPEEKIMMFLTSYFDECYPGMADNGLTILFYNDYKLRFYLTKGEMCYEMRTNDIIQRRNTFTYLPGIKLNNNKY